MSINNLINDLLTKQREINLIYDKIQEEVELDLKTIHKKFPPCLSKVVAIKNQNLGIGRTESFYLYTPLTGNKKEETCFTLDFSVKFQIHFKYNDELDSLIKEHNNKFNYHSDHFDKIRFSKTYYYRDGCAKAFDIEHIKFDKKATLIEYPELSFKCSEKDFIKLGENIISPTVEKSFNKMIAKNFNFEIKIPHENKFREWEQFLNYYI